MIKQAEIDLSYNLGRQAAMEKLSNIIDTAGYGLGGLGYGALLGAGLGAGYGAYMGNPALEAYGRSVPGVYAGEGLVYGGALGGLGGLGYGMYKNASVADLLGHDDHANHYDHHVPKSILAKASLAPIALAGIAGAGATYLGYEDAIDRNRKAKMSVTGALAPVGYGLGGALTGTLLGAGIGRAIGAYRDKQAPEDAKPIELSGPFLGNNEALLGITYGLKGLQAGGLAGLGYGLYRAYKKPSETKTAMDKLSQKGFFASMGEGVMNAIHNRPRIPAAALADIAAAQVNTMPIATQKEDDAVSNYMEEVGLGNNPKSILGVPTDSSELGSHQGVLDILDDPRVKGIPAPIADKKQWVEDARIAAGRRQLFKGGPHAFNEPGLGLKHIDVSKSYGPVSNNPIVLNHEYYHARKDKPEIGLLARLFGLSEAQQRASMQEEHMADIYASTAGNYDLWDVAKIYQDMQDEAPRGPIQGDDHVDGLNRLRLYAANASGTSPRLHKEMAYAQPGGRPPQGFRRKIMSAIVQGKI